VFRCKTLDIIIRESSFLACYTEVPDLIFRVNIHYAVRVDVERDFDLWYPSRSWRNAIQIEISQFVAIFCQPFNALKHLDQ